MTVAANAADAKPGQPPGGEQQAAADLHGGVDLRERLRVGWHPAAHRIREHLQALEGRPGGIRGELRTPQRVETLADEDGRQHGTGNSANQHGAGVPGPVKGQTSSGVPLVR